MKNWYPKDKPYKFMEDLVKEYGAEKAMEILISSARDVYHNSLTNHKGVPAMHSVYAKSMWSKRLGDEKLLSMINTKTFRPLVEISALLAYAGYDPADVNFIQDEYQRLAHDGKVTFAHDDNYGISVKRIYKENKHV